MTKQPHDICKEVYKKLESVQHIRHLRVREIFDDFCTIAMAAYHNALYSIGGRPVPKCYRETHAQMEADYTETLKKYDTEGKAYKIFAEALAVLAMAMRENPFDYLGKIYMDASMGNKSTSQFFTPSHICELMAQMTIGSKEAFEQQVSERGFVGAADPCCGSGAMTIGLAKVLDKEYGVQGLESKLFIKLTDIDYTCVKMAFISMSLLGLSACVVLGDTLTGRIDGQFDTPNLQAALTAGSFRMPEEAPAAPPVESDNSEPCQLTLF